MMNYVATFSRYSKTQATRERSGEWLFRATDFEDACRTLGIFVQGMKDADRQHGDDWQYEIAALRCDSYGADVTYAGYLTIWENPPTT